MVNSEDAMMNAAREKTKVMNTQATPLLCHTPSTSIVVVFLDIPDHQTQDLEGIERCEDFLVQHHQNWLHRNIDCVNSIDGFPMETGCSQFAFRFVPCTSDATFTPPH